VFSPISPFPAAATTRWPDVRAASMASYRAWENVVPPQLTPIYAPPEALLDNHTPAGLRPILHPSLDVYAAALVIYAMAAGRVPYDHLGVDLTDVEVLLDVKREERRGQLSPISNSALKSAMQ